MVDIVGFIPEAIELLAVTALWSYVTEIEFYDENLTKFGMKSQAYTTKL
jgi:hypothetical protein